MRAARRLGSAVSLLATWVIAGCVCVAMIACRSSTGSLDAIVLVVVDTLRADHLGTDGTSEWRSSPRESGSRDGQGDLANGGAPSVQPAPTYLDDTVLDAMLQTNRRAASAAYFTRAYAPFLWTAPTFGSILTDTIPSRHSAAFEGQRTKNNRRRSMDPLLPTLANASRK